MANDVSKIDDVPSWVTEYSGGTGFENAGADDRKTPFLRIAQALSGIVQEVDGMKAGVFYNSATGKNYGQSIKLIPVNYYRSFEEWKGIGTDAVHVGTYTPEKWEQVKLAAKFDEAKNNWVLPNGSTVQDTRNYFVYCADDIEAGLMLYPMYGSGIGAARNWMSLLASLSIAGKQIPMFSKVWELTLDKKISKGGMAYFQVASFVDAGWTDASFIPSLQGAYTITKDLISSGRTVIEAKATDDDAVY